MKRISAVLPTIGRLEYVDKAITSLLNQTVPFDEIIIFDNSVEQNLRELSEHCNNTKIEWVKSGNQLGPIESWNMAVSKATCEYATIMGDDDIMLPVFCERAKTKLETYDLVIAPFLLLESGKTIKKTSGLFEDMKSEDFRKQRMLVKFSLMVPGVIFKLSKFMEVGGFVDSGFPRKIYSDDSLWFRLGFFEKEIGVIESICWYYRIHDGQIAFGIKSIIEVAENAGKYIDHIFESAEKAGINKESVLPDNMKKCDYEYFLIATRLNYPLNYYFNNRKYISAVKEVFTAFKYVKPAKNKLKLITFLFTGVGYRILDKMFAYSIMKNRRIF